MNALTFARQRLLLTSALVAGAAAVSPLGAGLAYAQTETTAGDVDGTIPFAPPADAPGITDVAGGVQVNLKVQKSVINWKHFNIVDPSRTINFSDLSGLPAGTIVSVLNRVVGNGVDPIEASVINGLISSSSNVVVWISNPMGITFGSSGVFSGGSLVLTTAAITTSDFRGADDNYSLTGASSGTITLAPGSQINASGQFVAMGQNITSGGTITAGQDVALIAAQDIDLTLSPGSPISFTIKAGTTVGSAKLNSDGTINASSITLTGAGRRTAGSESDLLLEISGTLTATAVGGKVFLGLQRDAGDDTIGGTADRMQMIGDTTLIGTNVEIASALDSDATARALDIQGNARLGGALGATSALSTLSVSGTTQLDGGSVTANLTQDYTGAVTLGAGTVLKGTLVTFNSTVDGAQGLSIDGNAVFKGAVGGSTALTGLSVAGSTVLEGGLVATTGIQAYNGSLVLGADTTLTSSGGGPINFGSTVDSDAGQTRSLTTTSAGVTSFGGRVGATDKLSTLTVNGLSALNVAGSLLAPSIQTTGAQTYTGGVTLGADTVLSGTSATFGSTVDGAQLLAVDGNAVFRGAVGGSTALTGVAVTGATEFDGGSVKTSGAQTYTGAVTLKQDAALSGSGVAFGNTVQSDVDGAAGLTTTATSKTLFTGAVGGGGKALKALTTNGTAEIAGGSVITKDGQTYNGAVVLTADTTLTSNNGGAVTFGSTVDSGAGTTRALTTATTGLTTFGGKVGSTDKLSTLTVNGGTVFDAAGATTVSTTGAQTYTGAVTLKQDTTLAGTNITFASTVQSDADGGAGLETTATGKTRFAGAVGGGAKALKFLTTNGLAEIAGGSVVTRNAQTYNNAVVLAADTTLTSNNGGAITFKQTVDSDAGQTRSLTTASTGLTTFEGRVGATDKLSTLTVNGPSVLKVAGTLLAPSIQTTGAQTYTGAVTLGADTVLSGTTMTFGGTVDGAQSLDVAGGAVFKGAVGGSTALTSLGVSGTTEFDGGSVRTTGAQTYSNAVTLKQDATLSGSAITFATTVQSDVDGAAGLTATATSGKTLFTGAVGGGGKALKALTTNGNAEIAGGSVITKDGQTYNGAVVLTADTTLTSNNGGAVTFGSTVDSGAGQTRALTTATTGLTTFGGKVGSTDKLSTLLVNGGTVFDATGATTVSTTGAQTYTGAVTLKQDTTLAGTVATFGSTVNGGQSLGVTGNAVFKGVVGGTAALTALSVSGTTEFDAAGATTVTTTGEQTYTGAVTLKQDTGLKGAKVNFGSTVKGTKALAIDGDALFKGVVGGNGAAGEVLSALSVTGKSEFDVAGAAMAPVSATVTTTGEQAYGGAVTLAQDTVFKGSKVSFAAIVDGLSAGAQRLGVLGDALFAGNVGGVNRLRSVTVVAPGAITATGSINALEAITLDAGGAIALVDLTATDAAAGSGNILINQNGGLGPVAVAGNVAAAGDYLLTGTSVVLGDGSARTQRAGRKVSITATSGDVAQGSGLLTVQSDSDGTGTRTANDALRITASNGSVALGNAVLTGGTLTSGVHGKQSDVFVDASANVTVKEAHGRSIGLRASAGALAADKLEALEDVFGKAGTTVSVTTSAIAGDDLNLTAGTGLTINQGLASGTGADGHTVDLSGATLGVIADAGAPNLANVTLRSAAGNIAATTLTAQRDVLVTAANGSATVNSATALMRDVKVLAGGDATLGGGSAGNDIVVDAGDDASLGTGAATNSILVQGVNNAALGNGTATNAFVTVKAGKVATVTGNVTAKTDYTVTGGTGVVLGDGAARTQKAGGKVTITATTSDVTQGAGLLTLQSDSDGTGGDALSVLATTGSVLLGKSVVQGGTARQSDVSIDAAKNAELTQVDGRNITVNSNQIALGGAMTGAASVTLTNRTSETNDTVIGGAADSDGSKYVLSATEISRITAPSIQIVTQQAASVTQNVQVGKFDLNAGKYLFGIMTAGSTDTSKITLGGAIAGSGFTGTLQIGGNTVAGSQSGSIVAQIDTASINLPTGELDLRARQIAFGRSSLLTDPALLSGDAARIARDLVSNAGSALYVQGSGIAGIGGDKATFLRAKSMRVTYSNFALFQNTGTPGSPAGVILGDPTQTISQSQPTLFLDARPTTSEDAFALFGTINGFVGRSAGLLPEAVVAFSTGTGTGRTVLISQPNSRINGCVIGAPDKGCLVTDVQPPALKLFDERQAQIFSTGDDDSRVLLDPLIATNNEALIGDLAVPTLNYEVPACELNAAGECDKGKK